MSVEHRACLGQLLRNLDLESRREAFRGRVMQQSTISLKRE